MITVDGLTVEFGGTTLFKDISFQINEKDRIALMGKNGAGKSTLLKIIFRRVKRHQVVVSAQRVLSPFAACCFETLWRRTGRHGEDDPAAVGTTIV